MHMHNTIKNNYNYTHIWVQIILSVRVTHFFKSKISFTLSLYFFFSFFLYTWVYSYFGGFFLWFIYIRLFIFKKDNINSSTTKIKKKKNLDRTHSAKLDTNLKSN